MQQKVVQKSRNVSDVSHAVQDVMDIEALSAGMRRRFWYGEAMSFYKAFYIV